MLKAFLQILFKLRISDSWRYKFPFIFSAISLLVWQGNIPFTITCLLVAASFLLMLGFAGFGYLTNDWADIEKDKLAGKANALEGSTVLDRSLLLLFFLLLLALPWWVLPFNFLSLAFVAAEILLFCLYSFKPFRWKEKGILGLLADTLYAHTLPVLFAAHTFYLAAVTPFKNYLLLLFLLAAWQTVVGMRNILFHQLADFSTDSQAAVKTFVVSHANSATIQLVVQRVLLPIEAILFFALLVFVAYQGHWLFLLTYPVFFVVTYIQKTGTIVFKTNVRQLIYTFADNFYYRWLPPGILLLCCIQNLCFGILIFLYLLAFNSFQIPFFKKA